MKVFGVMALVAVLGVAAFGQAKKGIEGVWQLSEITMTGKYAMTMKITQPSVYIFTKRHFSKIYVASDKPRPVLDDYAKASREEIYSIFVDGIDASGGTYEFAGGKMTLRPTVAKSPSDMAAGTWVSYAVTFAGDTATLTPEDSNTGPNKKSIFFKLTRVE